MLTANCSAMARGGLGYSDCSRDPTTGSTSGKWKRERILCLRQDSSQDTVLPWTLGTLKSNDSHAVHRMAATEVGEHIGQERSNEFSVTCDDTYEKANEVSCVVSQLWPGATLHETARIFVAVQQSDRSSHQISSTKWPISSTMWLTFKQRKGSQRDDETAVCLDTWFTTVNEVGAKDATIRTTGHQKLCVTIMLYCEAEDSTETGIICKWRCCSLPTSRSDNIRTYGGLVEDCGWGFPDHLSSPDILGAGLIPWSHFRSEAAVQETWQQPRGYIRRLSSCSPALWCAHRQAI